MASIGNHLGAGLSDIPSWQWVWSPEEAAQTCWQTWARQVAGWLHAEGVAVRDAQVLLPVGALLPLARQAWGDAVGGWLPRIDTIASLSAALAWQMPSPSEGLAAQAEWLPALMEPVGDRLLAGQLLGREEWGRQWARRDRRGFDFALDQVVLATHTWMRRMQAMAPSERITYAEQARACLQTHHAASGSAPGGRERLLLAWALEWALASVAQGLPGDAVFDQRPKAVVGVTAGWAVAPGTEVHWMLSALRHWHALGVPVLRTVAQPQPQRSPHPAGVRPCQDAEDEAQQAAAQALAAVNGARSRGDATPVALIAQDRSLVRRVRALLEGAGARIADETGWRLSTTRTAAAVSRLIQASHPQASTEDLLDWLKSGWVWGPQEGGLAQAAALLETWVRRHGLMAAWQLQRISDAEAASPLQLVPGGRAGMPEEALPLWRWAHAGLQPLRDTWGAGRGSLQTWLQALDQVLRATGARDALARDAAGQATLAALRLDEAQPVGEGWPLSARQARMDGSTFLRWVASVMEATTFRPQAPEGGVDVVITPMARAVLRPFAGVVLAGADERQLGALGVTDGWLSVGLREAMALATPVDQRAAQWDAFALLMNRPGVVCLHRAMAGTEPVEASPWLARWSQFSGDSLAELADAREPRALQPTPTQPPTPSLGDAAWAVPNQVTATGYEVMRQCPYRYFATVVLGLREQEELEEGLDRSDFGTWLHEVLRRFHLARQQQLAFSSEAEDVQAWLGVAQEVIHARGLDLDGQRPFFLPFQVDMARIAQAYVSWLRQHEADGWSVLETEWTAEKRLALDEGPPLRMHGQLDRVDTRRSEGLRQTLVLDYKTGSLEGVQRKTRDVLEDTQLAFYGALAPDGDATLAAYVHLDAARVRRIDHDDVLHSAEWLEAGLRQDWAAMRTGVPLQALGEGSACEHCQARGLCRKDHWPVAAPREEAA